MMEEGRDLASAKALLGELEKELMHSVDFSAPGDSHTNNNDDEAPLGDVRDFLALPLSPIKSSSSPTRTTKKGPKHSDRNPLRKQERMLQRRLRDAR